MPNDATNEARALLLLQDLGIITLSEDAGLEATKNDIVDNPHNIDLQEMEAAMLPQTIDEVDFSIINPTMPSRLVWTPPPTPWPLRTPSPTPPRLTPTSSP